MTDRPSPALMPRRQIRRASVFGLLTLSVLLGTLGVWAGTAPLAGAVIASGRVVVESNARKIQHPSGGVVAQINVTDSSEVRAGDVLIRLDDTNARASLAIIEQELMRLYARGARLEAERDGLDTPLMPLPLAPRAGEPEVRDVLELERRVFTARRAASELQRSQLRERIAQSHEEIEGLSAQLAAGKSQIELVRAELLNVGQLFDKQLISLSRYSTLQREETRLLGETGSLTADIARVKGRITETELQILQIDEDLRREGATELRDIDTKIADLTERRVAALDQLARIDLRAPQDGQVHQLSVHTIGGVIAPAQEVMLIIPKSDGLVIEARVDPAMIDRLHIGQEARVLFPAFDAATTPETIGEVVKISPDSTLDPQTGQSYFTLRVALAQSQVEKLGDKKLSPGMPAETYIQTGTRTAFAYVTKPISDQLERAFRYD